MQEDGIEPSFCCVKSLKLYKTGEGNCKNFVKMKIDMSVRT